VTVRRGADDANWLTLASKGIAGWQIGLVERRMNRLAESLAGEYDGYDRE
jgi:hypothetical protein